MSPELILQIGRQPNFTHIESWKQVMISSHYSLTLLKLVSIGQAE